MALYSPQGKPSEVGGRRTEGGAANSLEAAATYRNCVAAQLPLFVVHVISAITIW